MQEKTEEPVPKEPLRKGITVNQALAGIGLATLIGALVLSALLPDTGDVTTLVGFVALVGLGFLLVAFLRSAQSFLTRAVSWAKGVLARAMVGFATSAGWTPVIAVIATIVALYIAPDPERLIQRGFAVAGGLGFALIGWTVLAFLGSFHNIAARVNTRVYSDVSETYRTMRMRLEAARDGEATSAYQIAQAQLDWLHHCIGIGKCEHAAKPDVDWATGYRYIDLWSAIHRADEALLDLTTEDEFYSEVRTDQLRLSGSKLTGVEDKLAEIAKVLAPMSPARELLALLRADVRTVSEQLPGDASSDQYRLAASRLASVEERLGGLERQPSLMLGPADSIARMRPEMRAIRHAINEFRLGRMDGLVRARNRLARTTNATAWAIFLVLVAAIALGASRENLVAAVVFFSVGALIGLFAQLRSDAERDEAVEDYGLSAVRLRQTALASGLAAVAGVILTAIAINTTATSAAGGSQSLTQIFDASDSPGQLLIAAVFGLSPHVLIERLTATADQYRKDLSQTAPGDREAATT